MDKKQIELELELMLQIRTLMKTLENGCPVDEHRFLMFFHLKPDEFCQLVSDPLNESWNTERMAHLPTWQFVEQCYDLLDQIQKLEADRDASDLHEDLSWENNETLVEKKAKRFLDWLNSNGSKTSPIGLQLNEEKNSYEVLTVQPLENSMAVFLIHPSVFITTEFVKNVKKILPMEDQPAVKRLSRMIEDQTDRIRLALFIVHEKYFVDKKSFWKPYWDVLPRLSSYVDHCTYTKADMELVKDCRTAFRYAWREVKTVIDEYLFIQYYLIPQQCSRNNKFYMELKKVITYRRYLWARVRAGSRLLKGPRYYGEPCNIDDPLSIFRIEELIPMTDMTPLQEAYIPTTDFGVLEDMNGMFCCRSTQALPLGSKISMLAKHGSTICCFKDFGWVPENYPIQAEMYLLEIGLTKSDKLYDRKVKILEKLDTPNPMFFRVKPDLFLCDIETKANLEAFQSLIAFVRIVQGNTELLDQAEKESPEFLYEPTRESWIYLINRFKLLEKGAEKTVQNVLRKLNIGKDEISTLNSKQKAIVQYLMTEQATLGFLAESIAKRMEQEEFY